MVVILKWGDSMGICCRDLFQLKYFSKAKLIAGENGLYRNISWPYVKTTDSITEWLYGGELLFATYSYIDEDDRNISLLLKECIEKRVSGIVFLIDIKFMDKISQDVINKANEENLPLFVMPWNVKLIDITQEIYMKIEQKKEECRNAKHFLESILFSQDNNQDVQELSQLHNIKLRKLQYVCIFKIEIEKNNFNYKDDINKKIISNLNEILCIEKYTIIPMDYVNHLMILVSFDEKEDGYKSIEHVEAVFDIVKSIYEKAKIFLGFSRVRESNSEIKKSYEEAVKALSMINEDNNKTIVKYSELGITKLLFQLSDLNDIDKYCYENLGPLIEYDKKHEVNLIGTLKCYFQNNRHLLKTSQDLYIHRNTLIYRLSTIKDLLQKDLDDAMINLELFNSILIYEFLNIKKK